MALFTLLAELRTERAWRLVAAHFDHRLRPESAAEAADVRGWALARGIPCEVGAPAAPLAPAQAALRRARYAFLRGCAERHGCERIATGHHFDDQAETVLFRLLRGAGLRGLGGIPVRRGPIVRPLLAFRRDELEAFVRRKGIPFLTDPSNLDPRWARGRLRTDLLPALERAIGPEVRRDLVSLGRAARRADRMLDAAARDKLRMCLRPGGRERVRERAAVVELDRERMLAVSPGLRARILRHLARCQGVRLRRGGTSAGMEFIKRGRSGSSVDLGGGLRLSREFDALQFGGSGASTVPLPADDAALVIPGADRGRARLRLAERRFQVRWGPAGEFAEEQEDVDCRVALPAGRIQFPLRVRGWVPGDRIRLAAGTRKLKRLFVDRRVPRSRRAGIPVLAESDGRVLWVAGIAVARDVLPSGTLVRRENSFVVQLKGD